MSISRRHLFTLPLALGTYSLLAQTPPSRRRRTESFFGIHFDLHPNPDDKALGRDVNKERILQFLDAVKPDYVQYDSKGHTGWLGFPSQVGPSAPHIKQDSLAVWREATRERGVALYIHFSGVWDDQAVERHPEWAAVGRDGARNKEKTSTFGPYVDGLLIPQLKEAISKYDLDGAWVDGECWAVVPDWSDAAKKQFLAETKHPQVPDYPTDPGWSDWLELQRRAFRTYVKHYVDELHKAHPQVQIASNWLYSTMVPEKPTLPVDFLSGDFLGNAPIAGARIEARYLARNGMSWDLMAWGFQYNGSAGTGFIHKPAVQLKQEAGVVLAQGGGFQIYYQPSRAGHIDSHYIRVMEEVAQFCRARQPYCWKTETVPQIGVLYSQRHLYAKTNKLFGSWGNFDRCARGWLDALLAQHYSVDVLPDWQLEEKGKDYKLIVVPEWADIGDEAEKRLRALAAAGCSLVIAGVENTRRFQDLLGIDLVGEAEAGSAMYVRGRDLVATVRTVWQGIEAKSGTTILDYRFPDADTTKDGIVAATLRPIGNAKVIAVSGGVGDMYAETHAPALAQFLGGLVERAYQPMAECDAPSGVELVLRRKDGKLQVHLANTLGMQVAGQYGALDYISPVPSLRLRVRSEKAPRRVTAQPGDRAVAFRWKQGVTEVEYGPLAIYDILEFEGI